MNSPRSCYTRALIGLAAFALAVVFYRRGWLGGYEMVIGVIGALAFSAYQSYQAVPVAGAIDKSEDFFGCLPPKGKDPQRIKAYVKCVLDAIEAQEDKICRAEIILRDMELVRENYDELEYERVSCQQRLDYLHLQEMRVAAGKITRRKIPPCRVRSVRLSNLLAQRFSVHA